MSPPSHALIVRFPISRSAFQSLKFVDFGTPYVHILPICCDIVIIICFDRRSFAPTPFRRRITLHGKEYLKLVVVVRVKLQLVPSASQATTSIANQASTSIANQASTSSTSKASTSIWNQASTSMANQASTSSASKASTSIWNQASTISASPAATIRSERQFRLTFFEEYDMRNNLKVNVTRMDSMLNNAQKDKLFKYKIDNSKTTLENAFSNININVKK
ncbi:uncharacterized protein LOC111031628 [Myzus persicae]|uniref:uncharacterized protein LOC111031628 n=1 Tax=Myzus persicae TaxID=13164 RepID=UPI000B934C20|nr:uncharacterized protein LOC111031628 [Myzus persicae]